MLVLVGTGIFFVVFNSRQCTGISGHNLQLFNGAAIAPLEHELVGLSAERPLTACEGELLTSFDGYGTYVSRIDGLHADVFNTIDCHQRAVTDQSNGQQLGYVQRAYHDSIKQPKLYDSCMKLPYSPDTIVTGTAKNGRTHSYIMSTARLQQ